MFENLMGINERLIDGKKFIGPSLKLLKIIHFLHIRFKSLQKVLIWPQNIVWVWAAWLREGCGQHDRGRGVGNMVKVWVWVTWYGQHGMGNRVEGEGCGQHG